LEQFCVAGTLLALAVTGPAAAEPAISRAALDYLVIAEHRLTLHTSSRVAGNIAVNLPGGTLRVGRRALLGTGTVAIADRLRILPNATVFDAVANVVEADTERVTVGGVLSQPVPPPALTTEPLVLPDPFDPAHYPAAFPIACGGPIWLGEAGEAAVLPAGSYSRVYVGRGGRLVLEPGTYQFCSLRVARRGVVQVDGPTTINVRDQLKIGNEGALGPATGSPAAVRVNAMGSQLRIGQQAVFRAHLFAPDGSLRVGRETVLAGRVLVEELRGAPGLVVSMAGGHADPTEDMGAP
jgi:hypothetical protein